MPTTLLEAHDDAACIASVHSAGRTGQVVEMLEGHRCSTVVLHWWNGTTTQTRRAVDLGCYFSINARNLRTAPALALIPPERLLPETDHPYADRAKDAQPGKVQGVERALAEQQQSFRIRAWQNFGQLMDNAGAMERLPTKAQGIIFSVRQ
ncbi:TatD family hydrolase [Candidatus Poriferisodalis sp.]|uniref:TatD family hydrolase n=1 Tax=Candidatus Poriferisodalis sp. TaxID=3101277 RepID=UPI003B52CC16